MTMLQEGGRQTWARSSTVPCAIVGAMDVLACVVFALLTLLAVSLQKTYWAVPVKELKRAARQGDPFATALFKASGYGYSLQVVLWGMVGMFAAGFFLAVANTFALWMAFPLSVLLVWLSFYWVPSGQVTGVGRRVAVWLAPAFAWVLSYAHPVIDWLVAFVQRHRPVHIHTGLYEEADLIDLLEVQRQLPDNRIDETSLAMAERAIQFGSRIVRDALTPRRVVKSVRATDAIGPVLVDELHKSGFSRFPVHTDDSNKIVGILHLRDVRSGRASGHVADVMHASDVIYIHEEQPLSQALHAMLRLRRHLMIVVNSFEEYVGVITLEDVIEQVVGKPIVDEFDAYDDMRTAAAALAAKDHAKHIEREEG